MFELLLGGSLRILAAFPTGCVKLSYLLQVRKLQEGQAWLRSQVEKMHSSGVDEPASMSAARSSKPKRQLSF